MIDVLGDGSTPRLVVFDLDGTLYPKEAYAEQVLSVIGRMFVELRGASVAHANAKVAELREAMRTNWAGTSTTSFVRANGFDVAQWLEYRETHLSIADGLARDEGVVRELGRLREVVPIVLLTNNTRGSMTAILDKVGLGVADFTEVFTSEDSRDTPKPDPGAFRVVLQRCGVPAAGTWSVGDRVDIDIEPLRRLGGSGIAVDGPADLGAAVDHLIGLVRRG
ncbi:haloacid dehalogenase-like hydrolase [Lentzea albidocapillata subsp. violacea]|uniref:Haloacid dehalogenase-like hydrolase n=1 Tax=Lentzea albidocapillata subsp. violacea TaxID=128104 RepID=A0A1G8RVF4_9PSEU|nr:HAD family hydrolase [Lentzea albidocapillata]SDJ21044.1 haloacid dehalogenase-like hydrolase [Lentzea albidocapillata subsp. violacea]